MVTRRRDMLLALAALLAACVMATGVAQAADTQYGPCCPVTHGDRYQTRGNPGPRYTCGPPKRISLRYGAGTQTLEALEVAGNLLVPARVFGLVGADVAWSGGRQVTATREARTVCLTLGSHAVKLVADGKPSDASWDLCPRLRDDVTYVPLRSMAEALGLAVAWQDGAVVLSAAGSEASAAPAASEPADTAAKCPADRVEEALKVKVLRSPADSPFGPGVQVLELLDGSPLKALEVQSGDVIVVCDGQRTKCPRDLDVLLAQEQAHSASVKGLVVMRGAEKLTLPAQ